MQRFIMTYLPVSGKPEHTVFVRLLSARDSTNAISDAMTYMESVQPDYIQAWLRVQPFDGKLMVSNANIGGNGLLLEIMTAEPEKSHE